MRTLVLSVGNTSLYGGVFVGARFTRSFRIAASALSELRGHVGSQIDCAAVCSVVPALTPDVTRTIQREWNCAAALLSADSELPFKIGYRRPKELGTDRIAAAWGAWTLEPRANVIVVDCGTATTVTALSRRDVLLGGAILPGLSLWTEMLATRTAQLPSIDARRPRVALGRSTSEAIASGIFHGHAGAIREVVSRVRTEAFGRGNAVVIGTGGNAPAFAKENLFDRIEPALVLHGLQQFSLTAA